MPGARKEGAGAGSVSSPSPFAFILAFSFSFEIMAGRNMPTSGVSWTPTSGARCPPAPDRLLRADLRCGPVSSHDETVISVHHLRVRQREAVVLQDGIGVVVHFQRPSEPTAYRDSRWGHCSVRWQACAVVAGSYPPI